MQSAAPKKGARNSALTQAGARIGRASERGAAGAGGAVGAAGSATTQSRPSSRANSAAGLRPERDAGRNPSGASSRRPSKPSGAAPSAAAAVEASASASSSSAAAPPPAAAAAASASASSSSPAAAPAAERAGGGGLAPSALPEGSLGVHRQEVSEPVPLRIVGDASDEVDQAFVSHSFFSEEDQGVMKNLKAWSCKVKLHDTDWDVQVRGLPAGDSASKVAVTLHGLGQDRSVGFWSKFWPALHRAGYHVLSFDMPGHGRSSQRSLPARGSQDAELLLAILTVFTDLNPGQVACIADAGGCATFFRAYTQRPDLFAWHHLLANPITSEIPAKFKATMEAQGSDLFALLADGGYGAGDPPFTVANCAVFFGLAEEAPDRVNYVMLECPGGSGKTPGCKAMRAPEYLQGRSVSLKGVSRSSTFFALLPNEECVQELLAYLDGPRRAIVKEGGPAAPMKTALEMGEVNESFRVFVRIRPMIKREKDVESCVKVEDVTDFPREPPPQRISIRDVSAESEIGGMFKHHAERGDYVFDRVFEPGNQKDIFESVARPLVETVLQGTNVTMFAYGQTGTGKTYTMEGPPGDEGLMHESIHMLFSGLGGAQKVYYQYVQLYNADFKDLLDPEAHKAFAVEEGKKFMFVRHATVAQATSADGVLAEVAKGAQYRASGKTNMNDASSRSHAILSVVISEGDFEDGTVMYLVDLAGSERVKRSGVQAGSQAFAEATSINSALSALGRVVVGLVERDGKRAAHIPYKDNALTHLLKSGVGGNSKTALICCITAAHDSMDESLNTLRFALQASHVKNQVANKEKKDQEAAAAAALVEAGHELKLSADGTGQVDLASGPVPVRGIWEGDGPVLLCVHDTNKDGSQFDGLIEELRGKGVRVLAPSLDIKSERDHDPHIERLLAILDWLGIAKPVCMGYDFGAVLLVSLKIKHPSRAGAVVLENLHQFINESEFKARMKKEPDYVMKMWIDCWLWMHDMMNDKQNPGKNVKGFKGKAVLLWPCHNKGRPDPKMAMQHMGVGVAKNLKTKLIDTYGWSLEQRAAEVLKVLKPDA